VELYIKNAFVFIILISPFPLFLHPLTMSYNAGQVAAARLDAADGVIDGRFYGNKVVAGAGYATTAPAAPAVFPAAYGYGGYSAAVPSYGAYSGAFPAYGYGTSSYSAGFPAAYGFQGARTFATAAPYTSLPATTLPYGGAYSTALPATTLPYGGAYSTALPATTLPYGAYSGALPYGAAVAPYAAYGGAYSTALPATTTLPYGGAYSAALPAAYGAYSTGFPAAFGAPSATVAASQSHALSLDAADGRLDGTHFGSGIVSARPY
jgi:hypothetical protein